MVHDIDSISAESVPKMEALLNRISKRSASISVNQTHKSSSRYQEQQHVQQQPTATQREDYVMEIDDFYPPASRIPQQYNTMEEDYDMMIDDDFVGYDDKPKTTIQLGGTHDSKWAKSTSRQSHRNNTTISSPAYLDNDPTLIAPKRPYRPQHTSIYNYKD
jgi:hypothetical protein